MVSTLAHLFSPQTSNNHRPRILHPMGLVVITAFTLFFHSGLELFKQVSPPGLVLGYASNITTQQVLISTNDQRARSGLPPLQLNPLLSQAARAKAANMFSLDYWAHISPQGVTPWKYIKDTGYKYSVAGENLARDFDSTPQMVSAWMDSPTHKANIVHQKYEETGIAVVNGKLDGIETTLVVQMFGKPVASLQAQPSIQPPQPELASGQSTQAPLAQAPVFTPEPAVLSQSEPLPVPSPELPTATKVSPTDIRRSVSLAMVMIVVAAILIDEVVVRHKKPARFVGRNLAHFGFVAVIIIIIFSITKPGGIL